MKKQTLKNILAGIIIIIYIIFVFCIFENKLKAILLIFGTLAVIYLLSLKKIKKFILRKYDVKRLHFMMFVLFSFAILLICALPLIILLIYDNYKDTFTSNYYGDCIEYVLNNDDLTYDDMINSEYKDQIYLLYDSNKSNIYPQFSNKTVYIACLDIKYHKSSRIESTPIDIDFGLYNNYFTFEDLQEYYNENIKNWLNEDDIKFEKFLIYQTK